MNARSDAGADYSWGPPGPLQVGLLVDTARVRLARPFAWRWALRSGDGQAHQVTLRHIDDPRFRCLLQLYRQGGGEPLWEFPPDLPPPALRSGGDSAIVTADAVLLDGGSAAIEPEWGPGQYLARIVFGGGPFRFEYRSGDVRIAIGEGAGHAS